MSALFAGLMSGTSMDGVDAALLDFSASRPVLLATHSEPYPESVHRELESALALTAPLEHDLSALDARVAEVFALAASGLLGKAGITAAHVTAIGSHGQTIRHEPDAAMPYSLQIGDAATISRLTGIDVVADFRSADIRAGGQGAPLVPAFHKALFASARENRVVLNIGGIANITVLPADPTQTVTGFDTGPGNTLMDGWIKRHRDQAFDQDGEWAASGSEDRELLGKLLADDYFSRSPPKSTGREYFNLSWLDRFVLRGSLAPVDVQATLCRLASGTIGAAIRTHAPATRRVLVCGGGAHNRLLMQQLASELPDRSIESTDNYGIAPDWVEAAAFAWLAKQHLAGMPGNIPEVTGAGKAVVLGTLAPAEAAAASCIVPQR